MTKIQKLGAWIIGGVVVGLLVAVLLGQQAPKSGGVYNQVINYFREGICVGTSCQYSVDGSGNTSSSGTTVVSTFTQGGGIAATSTSGSVVPLLAADFDIENVIDVTLNVQDATLSFPATSTLTSFIPTAGQSRTLFIRNASTTAAMDITISGGTGVLLKKATSSAIVRGDTDGANYARIQLVRKADSDIEAFLDIFLD